MPLPQSTDRSPYRSQRFVECKNVGSSEIPAYAIVQVISSTRPEKGSTLTPGGGRTVLNVKQITDPCTGALMVVGQMKIPVNEHGYCTNDFPSFVLYSGTPGVGQVWGPVANSYSIANTGTGFVILDDAENGIVRVLRVNGGHVSLLEALSCFHPGDANQTFTKYICRNGAWVSDGTVLASDPTYQNFLLPGEQAWAWQPFGCGSCVYYLLGEHGLSRMGKVVADTACDGTGSATIHYHSSLGSCDKSESACTVTFCNDWGYTRCIKADEEIQLRFMERRWIPLPPPRNSWYRATLSSDLCPGDAAAALTGASAVDYCVPAAELAAITSATNEYNLSACAGDAALVLEEHASCGYARYLVNVKHQTKKLVEGIKYEQCELKLKHRDFSVMYCCQSTPDWGCPPVDMCVPMYSITALASGAITCGIEEVQGQSCNLKTTLTSTAKTFCVFDNPSATPNNSSCTIPMTAVTVVEDLTPTCSVVDVGSGEGSCQVKVGFSGTKRTVYVPCAGTGPTISQTCTLPLVPTQVLKDVSQAGTGTGCVVGEAQTIFVFCVDPSITVGLLDCTVCPTGS